MKNNVCLILNRSNPYGFKVNINHPLVLKKMAGIPDLLPK